MTLFESPRDAAGLTAEHAISHGCLAPSCTPASSCSIVSEMQKHQERLENVIEVRDVRELAYALHAVLPERDDGRSSA